MMIALAAAFVAAYPVNRYLLQRGKVHALTEQFDGVLRRNCRHWDPAGVGRLMAFSPVRPWVPADSTNAPSTTRIEACDITGEQR
jgi:hypothetical protein